MNLLLLDLDETLLHSREEPLARRAEARIVGHHTYLRPHVATFLQHAQRSWRLAIWTAAGAAYAREAIALLERESGVPLREACEFVFTSDRCTPRRDLETFEQVNLKDLKKVRRLGHDLNTVLVLDDTPAGLKRHRGNLLHAPRWEGDPNDTFLRDILPYLDHLTTRRDLRSIDKRNWRQALLTRS